MTGKYKVITLCGSTRFKEAFLEAEKRLTLEGNIVLSVGLFGHSGDDEVWSEGVKDMLDDMHRRKIDMADEIFVINVGGYIGESTRSEIEYALMQGKAVGFLEDPEAEDEPEEETEAAPAAEDAEENEEEESGFQWGDMETPLFHFITEDDLRQYGRLYLQMQNPDTREAACEELCRMEKFFPEAGLVLGQYYQGRDDKKAMAHFRAAAEACIHEGEWCCSAMMKPDRVPDRNIPEDAEYESCMLKAAEGGVPNAANEAGRLCMTRGCILEAAYWYALAEFFGYPESALNVRDILQKWIDSGKDETYRAGTAYFNQQRHRAAVCFLKTRMGGDMTAELMALAGEGETLAGLTLVDVYEKRKAYREAYRACDMMAYENHPHVLSCYADMIMEGRGTTPDLEGALTMYDMAAKDGNAHAMYVLGEYAAENGDRDLAACWFGQALSRGLEMAGERLIELSDRAE